MKQRVVVFGVISMSATQKLEDLRRISRGIAFTNQLNTTGTQAYPPLPKYTQISFIDIREREKFAIKRRRESMMEMLMLRQRHSR